MNGYRPPVIFTDPSITEIIFFGQDGDEEFLIEPDLSRDDVAATADALSAVLVSGPAHGSLSLYADGSFSYTHNAGFNGTDSFTYLARNTNGDSTPATVTIAVSNVAPMATIVEPSHVVQNQVVTFTFAADDPSPADDAAGFTYDIDWDGDGTTDETVSGGGEILAAHTFSTVGDVTVGVTATDKDGGVSNVASHALSVIQPVDIDVRPEVNLTSNGVIAVTLFTTDLFAAATVDINSLIFANAFAADSVFEDVDGGGDLDLLLHYRVQDTNLAALYQQLLIEDLDADGVIDSTNQEAEVSLTGETLDDVLIQGTDTLDLFLRGKALRELLDELFAEP